MGDFIKELNIIDFLGLLLPGSFLLLMVNYTQTHKLTGLEFTAADIIFLIVGGYVVGSLLHDVWKIIELGVWKAIILLDPKLYAAEDAERIQKKANITLKNCVEKYFLLKDDALKGGNKLENCLIGLGKILSRKRYTYDNVWIREANPLIQTALVEKGNYRKRIVFDGFHVMMRNLFYVSILTIVIPPCVGIPIPLYEFLSEYIKNSVAVIIIIAVGLLLMAGRSWHYAYLKYKYSYEDFMVLCADKNNKGTNV